MVYRVLSREKALRGVQEDYVIEPFYTVLEKEALKNNIKVKKIVLTNIGVIGKQGFFGCTALRDADFPKTVKIGKEAFANCSNMKEAMFPGDLCQIGESAFSKCKRLSRAEFSENKD